MRRTPLKVIDDAEQTATDKWTDDRGSMPSMKTLTVPEQLTRYVPTLSEERLEEAKSLMDRFRFQLPEFYAQKVLNGSLDDPLLDLVFPSAEEALDGEELWDATPSPYSASKSPFWIQKYEFQGLLRVTTACSGHCRFCYLKKKNNQPSVMRVADVDRVFDDLESRGGSLHEIILSGGDPLCAPPDTLKAIATRMNRWSTATGGIVPHITVHTREPVWNPVKLLRNRAMLDALRCLAPKTYMLNILHPREVTAEFVEAVQELAEVAGPEGRPALLVQHPLFRGVNDSADVLIDLYRRLLDCSPPVLPYYMVHPFYNGTLPKHRLRLEESQAIYRELVRRPGCLIPRLVVPTPQGKCIVGPNEPLVVNDDGYVLVTKDGQTVHL